MTENLERRDTLGGIAVTSKGSKGAGRSLSGYAAVFFQPGEPGTQYMLPNDVVERISRRAFDSALARPDDCLALFNHNSDCLLGRVANESLKLTVDERGLKFTIDMPETSLANDLLALVRAGTLSTCSFQFVSLKSSMSREKDTAIRTVEDLRLYDVGPVHTGAYSATSVWLGRGRAMTPQERESVAVRLRLLQLDRHHDIELGRVLPSVREAYERNRM